MGRKNRNRRTLPPREVCACLLDRGAVHDGCPRRDHSIGVFKAESIFNVTFEPGCRNNWHIHHAKSGGGQILVCVAGRGYYQEEGKEAVEMKPGDCINIPAEVKHWHGAAPDSWFSHLAVEVPGVEGSNEWCEPVSDEEYGKLK